MKTLGRATLCCAVFGALVVSLPPLAAAQETPASSAEAPATDAATVAPATNASQPPATDAATVAPATNTSQPPAAPTVATAAPAEAPSPPKAAAAAATKKSTAEAEAEAEADAAAAAAAAEVDLAASAQIEEYKLSLYGFADFMYSQALTKPSIQDRPAAFAIGNLNLYMGSELGDDWRWLSEVRFMYLPQGSVPYGSALTPEPGPRTDTTVEDYAEIQSSIRWGGVSIERAYFEHTFISWFSARAGQFLTPYGIWNVDHGSPVIVGVRRAYIIGQALFPARQTGLELYGSGLVGPVELGYHATVSNGRGPLDAYADLDRNKAVGGRVYVRSHSGTVGTVTVGASGYRGRYTDAVPQGSFSSDGSLRLSDAVTAQYEELALAADLKWERKGLLVQSEAVLSDRAFTDSVRPPTVSEAGSQPGRIPDHRRAGVYVIGGYRFQFLGVMPWAGVDYFSFGKHDVYPTVAALVTGLNLRPTARVTLKGQYTHVSFPSEPTIGGPPRPLNLLDFQGAWSF
jgi:hypothetical protein